MINLQAIQPFSKTDFFIGLFGTDNVTLVALCGFAMFWGAFGALWTRARKGAKNNPNTPEKVDMGFALLDKLFEFVFGLFLASFVLRGGNLWIMQKAVDYNIEPYFGLFSASLILGGLSYFLANYFGKLIGLCQKLITLFVEKFFKEKTNPNGGE